MGLDLDWIFVQLRRRASERQLTIVAAGSGVGLRTIHRIMTGASANTSTMEKLNAYLKATARRKSLAH